MSTDGKINEKLGRSGRARGTRRQLILAAATRLFNERGFHAIGMDDIGAAAGITGPGIYRHFKSKDEILESLMERVADNVEQGVVRALMDARSAEEALELIVASHVRIVLDDPALVTVYFREAHNLQAEGARHRRARRRAYVRHWLQTLADVRDDLGEDDRIMVVNASIGLINTLASIPSSATRSRAEMLGLQMALATLHASVPSAGLARAGSSR